MSISIYPTRARCVVLCPSPRLGGAAAFKRVRHPIGYQSSYKLLKYINSMISASQGRAENKHFDRDVVLTSALLFIVFGRSGYMVVDRKVRVRKFT